jgi:hypothetical protein
MVWLAGFCVYALAVLATSALLGETAASVLVIVLFALWLIGRARPRRR